MTADYPQIKLAAYGHPIFDLQSLYASLVAIEKERPMYYSTCFGISGKNCERFWDSFYPIYMGNKSREEQNLNQTKALR